MYSLSCKEMGKGDCHYEATADTKEKVASMLMTHFKKAHAADYEMQKKSMSDQGMMDMMIAKVHEAM